MAPQGPGQEPFSWLSPLRIALRVNPKLLKQKTNESGWGVLLQIQVADGWWQAVWDR